MRILLICCWICYSVFCKAQADSSQVVFLLDGYRVSSEVFKQLDPQDLDSIYVCKEAEGMKKMGYEGIGGIVEMMTKAYKSRPDSLRQIPRLKDLTEEDGRYYRDGQPYTSVFIEYYLSGIPKMRGKMRNGYKEGCIESFYPDGMIQKQEFWENGKQTGAFATWYIDGSPRCLYLNTGSPKDLKKVCKYSDGRVKYVAWPVENGWKYEKNWEEVQKLLKSGRLFMEEGKSEEAEKAFTEAIRLNDGCAEAYYYRALVYSDSVDIEKSLKDIDIAITLDPARLEWYKDRAFYRVRKYLGNEAFADVEEEVPFIYDLPAKIQKAIKDDLVQAYRVLKEQDLLLSRMVREYTNENIKVRKKGYKSLRIR